MLQEFQKDELKTVAEYWNLSAKDCGHDLWGYNQGSPAVGNCSQEHRAQQTLSLTAS